MNLDKDKVLDFLDEKIRQKKVELRDKNPGVGWGLKLMLEAEIDAYKLVKAKIKSGKCNA